MNFLKRAAFAAAILTVPIAAAAQTNGGAMHDAMHGAMGGHMASATMLCRPATAKEHGNAMMMDSHALMVCKSLPAAGAATMGPDLSSKALTPAQVDAAWHKWLDAQLAVPAVGGG